MYLRISNNFIVSKSDIIGIFDMDNTTVSRQGRDFLPEAEKNGKLVYSADDLPKSYVVCEEKNETKVYISPISSVTLLKRANNSDFIK